MNAADINKILPPPRIRRGSRVAVFAPSGAVTWSRLAKGLRCLEAWGLFYDLSPGIFFKHHYLAGKDAFRAGFLLERLLSGTYDILWAARGGYGSVRLLPFLENAPGPPKTACWVIGFSDVSILLNYFALKWGLPCLHAPVIASLMDTSLGALASLRAVLWQHQEIRLGGTPWRLGKAKGPLVGGNLVSLMSLLGTPWFPELSGKILFLEEVNESTYRVDRLFTQLYLSGKLKGVKGMVLGSFIGVDPKRLREIVLSIFQGPVLASLPCGHTIQNYPLLIGQQAFIDGEMFFQQVNL